MTMTSIREPLRPMTRPHSLGAEPELTLVVADRRPVADGVVSLRLSRPDGAPLPDWEPGAHVDLKLDGGLVRQYSLTGGGADPGAWEVAVLLEPEGRGGSRQVFERLTPGARVSVRGPRNHFELATADHYRFIAGGIGITPLRAMVESVAGRDVDWALLYGGRSRSSMAFASELVDRYNERVTIAPQDEAGLLDLRGFLEDSPSGTLTYCCGPEPLLAAAETLRDELPGLDLRVERFAPRVDLEVRVDTEFEVELAQTGVTVTVPVGRSILEIAEEAGAFVTSSCEEGTCGSCETGILDGVPDHRDSVLGAAEAQSGETMMICVSRCRGRRLVLDL
jgi:ferredoxin-NADP reductase